MNLLDTALRYHKAGLIVLPNDPALKFPAGLKGWQKITPTERDIKKWFTNGSYAIGIRDTEGLDFDNKGDPDANTLYSDWYALCDELAPGLPAKLLLEQTPSGGYHTAWRCSIIAGNQKLATRPPTALELVNDPKLTFITLIETRGSGGQFQVAPSPGYTLISGDWDNLPTITPAERQIILDCARALTQTDQRTHKTLIPDTSRPGDRYNSARAHEALDLLKNAGWSEVFRRNNVIYLRRPGKTFGVSASFGHVAPGILYVFSSNASPFDANHAYTPFAILTELKYSGDYTVAASALYEEEQRQATVTPSLSSNGTIPPQQPPTNPSTAAASSPTSSSPAIAPPSAYFHNKAFVPYLLAQALLAQCQYIYCGERLHRYESGVYIGDGLDTLGKAIQSALINRWKSSYAGEVVSYIVTATKRNDEDVNKHHGLLNVRNGMLNLSSLILEQHDPSYLSLAQLPIDYDPNADTTLIDTFLESVIPADTIPIFWESVGSCFIRSRYSPKAVVIFIGPGDTGKSKLLEIVSRFFGLINIAAITLQSLADNRFASAELYGKLANIFSDLPSSEAQDAGRIKGLTGDDHISAERKFKESFRFKNVARLFFSANHYPIIRAADQPFFNRMFVIPCEQRFIAGVNADPQIVEKITTDAGLSGMLLRAIDGYRRLIASGERFSESITIQHRRVEYQMEIDSILAFVEHYTELAPTSERIAITKERWYEAYTRRCRLGGRPPQTDQKFYKRMSEIIEQHQTYGLTTEYTLRYEENDPNNTRRRWCYIGRQLVPEDVPYNLF